MPSRQVRCRARYALSVAALIAAYVVVMPIDGFSEPPADSNSLPKVTVDRTEIIKKLFAHQFDTLNSEMMAYEKKAEADPRYEMNALVAFGAFFSSQSAIADLLKDWCKAQPHSYAAKLAYAEALTSTAGSWRGEATIDNTPPQRLHQMELYYNDAVQQENAALAIDPNLSIAYALRIKAARVAGTADDDVANEAAIALRRVPASFAVREQIMVAAMPRWGGSRDAMEKFAGDAMEYVDENPALRFVNAWLPMDEGDGYGTNRQWYDAINSYKQALKVGGEYWNAYLRLAEAYVQVTDYKNALRAALRANELFPQRSDVLRVLAVASSNDNRPEACVLWASSYLRFEMPDPIIMQLAQQSAQELKAQGKGNW
jgi:tetratricopeptide (TPR) repeat protein